MSILSSPLNIRRRRLMLTCRTWMSAYLLLAATFALGAGDWLGGDELDRECRALGDSARSSPDDIHGTLCVAYLQGFIAGSTVAGVQREDSTAADTGGETFSDRAARTRAESYIRRVKALQRGAHCIGDDVPVSAVLEAINAHLESKPDEVDITDHALVHEALVRHFPCPQS